MNSTGASPQFWQRPLGTLLLGAAGSVLAVILMNPAKRLLPLWPILQDRWAGFFDGRAERRARKRLAELRAVDGLRASPHELYVVLFQYIIRLVALLSFALFGVAFFLADNSLAEYLHLNVSVFIQVTTIISFVLVLSLTGNSIIITVRMQDKGYKSYRDEVMKGVSRLLKSRPVTAERLKADKELGETFRSLLPATPKERGNDAPRLPTND